MRNLYNLHKKNKDLYVALTERSLNKGTPNQCKLISDGQLKLTSQMKIILAKIYKCD